MFSAEGSKRLVEESMLMSIYPEHVSYHPDQAGRSRLLINSADITKPGAVEAAVVTSRHRMIELPFTQLNLGFDQMFNYYKMLNFSPEYEREIVEIASEASNKLTGRFDLFIGIPTRKEVNTSRAVKAIQDNCAKSGLRPAIFVYHNYTNPEDAETMDDLLAVGDNPDVFLFEEQVPSFADMGNVRGKIGDVAMQYAQNERYEEMIYASGDADITRITGPLYRNAVDAIKKRGALASIGRAVSDPSLFSVNRSLAFQHLFSEAFEQAGVNSGEKVIPRIPRGSATVMDARLLCAVGSFPPVTSSEDLMLGFLIKEYLKIENMQPGDEQKMYKGDSSIVWIDKVKTVLWDLGGKNYTKNWEKLIDAERPKIPASSEINIEELKKELCDSFVHALIRHDGITGRGIGLDTTPLIYYLSGQFMYMYNLLFNKYSPEELLTLDLEKISTQVMSNVQPGNDKHKNQVENFLSEQKRRLVELAAQLRN